MVNFQEQDRAIDQYVAEIGRHPLLSRPDEAALARQYQENGDREAADGLIRANLRFVVKVAHEYRGYGFRLLDLVQEGNVGLVMAVRKFEPSRGYRLISYAVWWIRAYIQNFIMRSWSLVKLGTTQAQRKLFFKLRSERERADRAALPGTHATSAELADRLSVCEREVADMEVRLSARDFSLDAEVQDGARQTHLDLLENPDQVEGQEEIYAAHEQQALLRRQISRARRGLNEKEQYIVANRLMSDEPQTLQQIGHHFQISRERARQIEANVVRKMRHSLSEVGAAPSAA